MSITILFGGVNRERLVAVASAQSLARALPDADLWYWAPNGQVHAASFIIEVFRKNHHNIKNK